MTAYNELIFNSNARAFLKEGISNSATSIPLQPGGILAFIQAWTSSDELYLTFVDASQNYEIVKVTNMAQNVNGDVLTVERGQDGTTAREWSPGTLIVQRIVAANYTRFMQKGVFRQVAYDPNGILSAAYPGEKIQQAIAGPSYSWWKNKSGTVWQRICGDQMLFWDSENSSSSISFSDNKIRATWGVTASPKAAIYDAYISSEKVYWEYNVISATYPSIMAHGVCDDNTDVEDPFDLVDEAETWYYATDYSADPPNGFHCLARNEGDGIGISNPANPESIPFVIGFALDMSDDGKLWIALNNVWITLVGEEQGDPENGLNPCFENIKTTAHNNKVIPFASNYNKAVVIDGDAQSGYLTYSPPSGFTPLKG